MASFELWLEVLALTKALFDVIKSGADVLESYKRHHQENETRQEAKRVSEVFSTYSEDEVKAILLRLQGCRDRFIKQGSGAERASCVCSILNEVKKGNGDNLPLIDDWQNIYLQLGCDKTA